MLIAEELFLLVQPGTTDDAQDPFSGTPYEHQDRRRSWLALAAGILQDLVDQQRIGFTEARDGVEAGRLLVLDETAFSHPALDGALRRLKQVEGGLGAEAIAVMAEHLATELFEALAATGAIYQPHGEAYYQLSAEAEESNRGRLAALRELVHSGVADQRTMLLYAVLWGADLHAFVIGTVVDEATQQPVEVWIAQELAKAVARTLSPDFPTGPGPL